MKHVIILAGDSQEGMRIDDVDYGHYSEIKTG